MTYREERIAKSLFGEINTYFENLEITPELELKGNGVHWYCYVNLNDYNVSIYCCDTSSLADQPKEEFIISFFEKHKEIACGRVINRKALFESSNYWITHSSLEVLYSKFDFVDKAIRATRKLELGWLNRFPELKNITRVITNQGSGLVRYEISNNNRSCYFTTFGETNLPDLSFTWDECTLFCVQPFREETAEVLKRYLLDAEAPSSLSKVFSWIPVNNLTNGYEQGCGIEAEFIDSWEHTLSFYESFSEQSIPNKSQVIKFIKTLIDHGFNKTIRAGQSLFFLILSRSRRHGLLENQPSIALVFQKDHILVKTEHTDHRFERIELNETILKLVKELEQEEIN